MIATTEQYAGAPVARCRAYRPFPGNARSIHLMEKKRFFSHAEAEQVLRNAGYSQNRIEDLLRDLPDPLDIERDGDALFKQGVSAATLMDRMGASP